MNDKSKTILACGTANCIITRCFVGPHVTLELCSHVIWGTTNKLTLIQVAVPHTHVVFLLYILIKSRKLVISPQVDKHHHPKASKHLWPHGCAATMYHTLAWRWSFGALALLQFPIMGLPGCSVSISVWCDIPIQTWSMEIWLLHLILIRSGFHGTCTGLSE